MDNRQFRRLSSVLATKSDFVSNLRGSFRIRLFGLLLPAVDPTDCAHGLPDSHPGDKLHEAPSPARSGASSNPHETLFTENRGSIRALGATFHSFSRQTSSGRNGRTRCRPVSQTSRFKQACGRQHAKSSIERPPLPLQQRFEETAW